MTRSSLTLAFLSLLMSSLAHAGDYVDTRISVTFGDDDVLRDAKDPPGPSPLVGFGDRAGYLFPFDSLNTKYSGRETLTHLALYRLFPGFFASVTTEAAFVAVLQLSGGKLTPADAGSYLQVRYAPGFNRRRALSIVGFPFDSDRFRLGHLYKISVGGTGLYPQRAWFGAPGAKLQLDWDDACYFVGFKALATNNDTEQGETHYSGIAGAGWDLVRDRLRLDIGAGYFGMGRSPVKDIAGSLVMTLGASARVVLHLGLPIEESIDLTLYSNDPNRPMLFFRPVRYDLSTPAFLISAEVVALLQRLADPERPATQKFQRAIAGAIQARMQVHYLRLELTAMYRDLAFLYLENPGYIPYTAFPSTASIRPELLFAVTADYHFARLHLTLGTAAGVLVPATVHSLLYAGVVGSGTPTVIGEYTTTTVDGVQSILPDGQRARPLAYARLQARLDLSEMLAALAWVQYKHDPNATTLQLQPDLTKLRVLSNTNQLGFGISGVVRF